MESFGERQDAPRLADISEDHRNRYRWALERLGARGQALDAGCGTGYGTHMISQSVESVLGLDISEEAVETARRFWLQDNSAYEVRDLHYLHFDTPRKFDAVFCFECIEHLAVPELFLIRLRESCTPDTRIFFSTPHESTKPFHVERNPYHYRHFTVPDVKALMARAGFELVWLGSQHDAEVQENTEGGFLIGEARRAETEPELDPAALENEVMPRMNAHMTDLSRALARNVGLRAERDRLAADLKKRLEQLAELDKAYGKAETARKILVQQGDNPVAVQTAGIFEQLERLQRNQRELEKQVHGLRAHPAIRRLLRFNWAGLKLLGLLGVGGSPDANQHARRSRTHRRANEAGALGKLPVPDESLPEPHPCYVQGFSALSNIYGAQEKARSNKRIVLDVSRVFSEHLTGVGHYCDQLARALIRQAPHDIVLYSGKTIPEWMLEWEGYPQFHHCPPSKVVRDAAHYRRAPKLESLVGPYDVYVDASAAYTPMLRVSKRLTYIHDIAPISCPETVPDDIVAQCRAYAQFQVEHAGLLLANSEYTKKEFCEFTGLAANRMHVLPVGLDEIFRQPITEQDCGRVRRRYNLKSPYILCVGTLQPRKNLVRLVKAYGKIKKADPAFPQLILTGTDKWAEVPDFDNALEELHESHAIEWIGYVERLDMPALYNQCELFVYPSYFEGYGMPIAEAMASGAPVACGDRTSLPEVAGDAAVYFDPFDEEAIADALRAALADRGTLDALRAKSRIRAQSFLSWDTVAEQYLELMAPWLER